MFHCFGPCRLIALSTVRQPGSAALPVKQTELTVIFKKPCYSIYVPVMVVQIEFHNLNDQMTLKMIYDQSITLELR